MITLLIFSFIAGIVTILSPCILSILPILLSTTAANEKYKPIGVIVGLIVSFSFFTLAATSIVQATGISPDVFRYVAIVIIIFSGLILLIPSLETRFTVLTMRITQLGSSLQTHASHQQGLFSGLLLGVALGLIWTPCAGPILATITVAAATQGISLTTILMTLAYTTGAALPMLIIMYSGTTITTRYLSHYSLYLKKIFGVLMIASALIIAFNLDKKLQLILAPYFPTLSIENSEDYMKNTQIDMLHAPELTGITDWINSQPLSLEQLHGKVVLIDFWTYSCINCIRTLPHIKRWYQKYKDQGLEIIGVHTPEFAFEKNRDHVQAAVDKFCIPYPVALDSNYQTWQAYDNHYWPAHYLINKDGVIVYHHFGEGNYLDTENKIRNLLGLAPLMGRTLPETPAVITPETYLGCARADRYHRDIIIAKDLTTTYHYTHPLSADQVGLTGPWLTKAECIVSAGPDCSLDLNFTAHVVNLVMESSTSQKISLLLDGKPIPTDYYSSDTSQDGTITVHEPRMYELLNMKKDDGRHILTINCPQGVTLYVFTFG